MVEWLWNMAKSIRLSIKTWLAIAFLLRVLLITLKSSWLSQGRKTTAQWKKWSLPSVYPGDRGMGSIDLKLLWGEFVCCVVEATRVVSADYTYMCIFLKTNRLSPSLPRVCQISNWIQKSLPLYLKVDPWWQRGSGGGKKGQERSLVAVVVGGSGNGNFCIFILFILLYFILGHAHSMRKFLSWGLNLSHSSDTRSLTHHAKRELQNLYFDWEGSSTAVNLCQNSSDCPL